MSSISREMVAERRPFKTYEFIAAEGVRPNRSGVSNPNFKVERPTRRPFKTLEFVADDAEGCNQWVTHRYYNAAGEEVWRADHGSVVRALAVDLAGNVYTAGGMPNNTSHFKLVKWSPNGSKRWGIPVVADVGYDVSCDAAGNIWLAAGAALEKYDTNGNLLFSVTPIDDPWNYNNDGVTFWTKYCPSIHRVIVTNNSQVFFGASAISYDDFPETVPIVTPQPFLTGNYCNLDGEVQAVFYGYYSVPDNYPDTPRRIAGPNFGFYDYTADGDLLTPHYFSASSIPMTGYFAGFMLLNLASTFYTGALRPPGVFPPLSAGAAIISANLDMADPAIVHGIGAGAVAVHRPSGTILTAWGFGGAGTIKAANLTSIPGFISVTPYEPTHLYFESQPSIVTDGNAGAHGVLSVNDNFRFIYGADGRGCTHRVRDYPDTFVCQGDHKTTIHDAIMKPDNTFLVAGERVFDDCVPLPQGAVAGIRRNGSVTVYELDGTVRWTSQLLSTTSANHDVTFDSRGGVWARSGDGTQLVHADPTGVIVSDEVIGSPLSAALLPAIDHTSAGIAYCNFISNSPLADEAANGPTGALYLPLAQPQPMCIGITKLGIVVGWGGFGGNIYVWENDGTFVYQLNTQYVGVSSQFSCAAVDPVSNILHVIVFSTLTNTYWTGQVNLSNGDLSTGDDTLLPIASSMCAHHLGTPGGLIYRSTSFGNVTGLRKIDHTVGGLCCVAAGVLEFSSNGISAEWTNHDSTWASCAGLK